jgi:hypothetical protein
MRRSSVGLTSSTLARQRTGTVHPPPTSATAGADVAFIGTAGHGDPQDLTSAPREVVRTTVVRSLIIEMVSELEHCSDRSDPLVRTTHDPCDSQLPGEATYGTPQVLTFAFV